MSVVIYGERFKYLRRKNCKGETTLAVAERLGSRYTSAVYGIYRQWRVPTLTTLVKHAYAVRCRPWELLKDVETEYDLARALNDQPDEHADLIWRELLARYQSSTTRTPGRRQRATLPPLGLPGLAKNHSDASRGVMEIATVDPHRDNKKQPTRDITRTST